MTHYGLEPTTNNLGVAHENGDVEQEHRQFKRAVDQALRARGSRDFADRAAYNRFLQNLVKQRNLRRQTRWLEEREALRPLPSAPLGLWREVRTSVSRFSTIQVLRNTYFGAVAADRDDVAGRRAEMGNTQLGDGQPRTRRGAIQITGRAN